MLDDILDSPTKLAIAALLALCNVGGLVIWSLALANIKQAVGKLEALEKSHVSFREFRRWTIGVLDSYGLLRGNNPPPNGD